jgi:hypothetical protein
MIVFRLNRQAFNWCSPKVSFHSHVFWTYSIKDFLYVNNSLFVNALNLIVKDGIHTSFSHQYPAHHIFLLYFISGLSIIERIYRFCLMWSDMKKSAYRMGICFNWVNMRTFFPMPLENKRIEKVKSANKRLF